jgi:hypothetical protein
MNVDYTYEVRKSLAIRACEVKNIGRVAGSTDLAKCPEQG